MTRFATFSLVCLLAAAAAAQQGRVGHARELAREGDRLRALRTLEFHLLEHPNDTEARTLYGTILSWERRFDAARQELQRVIGSDRLNLDARLALIRVELWTGREEDAERLAAESMALFPDNRELTGLRSRVRRASSLLTVGGVSDEYKLADGWRESFVEFKREGRRGAAIARFAHAARSGRTSEQLEIQFYPRMGRRGWGSFAVAYAPDAVLYPQIRVAGEMYRAFGRTYEGSLGVSRLDETNVYTGSVGRYIGNWLVGGRVFAVEHADAAQIYGRRFFGDYGQYVEVRAGGGTTAEAIRSGRDIETIELQEIAVDTLLALARPWMVRLRFGIGSDRMSLTAAVSWRFER